MIFGCFLDIERYALIVMSKIRVFFNFFHFVNFANFVFFRVF